MKYKFDADIDIDGDWTTTISLNGNIICRSYGSGVQHDRMKQLCEDANRGRKNDD